VQPLSGALGSSSVAVSAPPRIAVAAAELQDVVSFSLGFRGSTYLIELQAISLQEYTSHSSIREKRRRDTSARPHTAARTRQELGSRLTQPRRSPHALGSAAQQCAGAPQWPDGGGWMRFCEQYSLLGVMRSLLGVKRGRKRRQRAI